MRDDPTIEFDPRVLRRGNDVPPSGAPRPRPDPLRALKRFVRSPKGYLLIILALLIAVAAPHEGLQHTLYGVAGAIVAAGLADVVIVGIRKHEWIFPSGAILTGLIVAMVLSAEVPLYVPVATSLLAIVSKHLLRGRLANIFNPAALAVVAATFVFGAGQSWWGALANLPAVLIVLVLVAGWIMAEHVNKMPLVLAFLLSYLALFTAAAFLGNPAQVAEIYRQPDINTALFFAFFMLDDPPTSPVRYGDQVIFGVLVAAASFAIFQVIGAVYFLPAGLLIGNAWEAWRRAEVPAARAARSTESASR